MGSIEDYDNYKSIESDSVLLIILIVQILNLILKTKLSIVNCHWLGVRAIRISLLGKLAASALD